jgi:hypothetical protein
LLVHFCQGTWIGAMGCCTPGHGAAVVVKDDKGHALLGFTRSPQRDASASIPYPHSPCRRGRDIQASTWASTDQSTDGSFLWLSLCGALTAWACPLLHCPCAKYGTVCQCKGGWHPICQRCGHANGALWGIFTFCGGCWGVLTFSWLHSTDFIWEAC